MPSVEGCRAPRAHPAGGATQQRDGLAPGPWRRGALHNPGWWCRGGTPARSGLTPSQASAVGGGPGRADCGSRASPAGRGVPGPASPAACLGPVGEAPSRCGGHWAPSVRPSVRQVPQTQLSGPRPDFRLPRWPVFSLLPLRWLSSQPLVSVWGLFSYRVCPFLSASSLNSESYQVRPCGLEGVAPSQPVPQV